MVITVPPMAKGAGVGAEQLHVATTARQRVAGSLIFFFLSQPVGAVLGFFKAAGA
jgi:hypothetical protein